jgi:hypothetical protein
MYVLVSEHTTWGYNSCVVASSRLSLTECICVFFKLIFTVMKRDLMLTASTFNHLKWYIIPTYRCYPKVQSNDLEVSP